MSSKKNVSLRSGIGSGGLFSRKGSHRFERVKTKRQLFYQSGKDRKEDSRRVTPCAQINSRSR